MRRDLPTIVGAALGLFGLAIVFGVGATVLNVSVETTTIVAGFALLGALFTARQTVAVEGSRATPPDTEVKAELPVPGTGIDETLAEIDADPLERLDERDDIQARLETVAVTLFTDRFGVREPVARSALADGTWTDDEHAAAFFAGEYPDWAPLRLQIRDWSTFTRTPPSLQAEHVVAELLAVSRAEYERLFRAPGAEEGAE